MWEIETTQSNEAPTMEINGNVETIEDGANLKDTVLKFARDAGFGKFKFFIDGEEVLPQNAPELIEVGRKYKIMAFDTAG